MNRIQLSNSFNGGPKCISINFKKRKFIEICNKRCKCNGCIGIKEGNERLCNYYIQGRDYCGKKLAYKWGAMSLEQVGLIMNLSRQRVEQIEKKALKKLRKKCENLKTQYEDYLFVKRMFEQSV